MEVMRLFDRHHWLSVFPLEDGSAQAVHSGAAVDASAHSAAIERASVRVAEFAERDKAVEPCVLGFVHHAHSSTAESFEDAVM
jgi:hypothetical protein